MSVTFPTRPGRALVGLPDRADPCRCHEGPLVIALDETCLRCGHYEPDTIDRTWADRVRLLARMSRWQHRDRQNASTPERTAA